MIIGIVVSLLTGGWRQTYREGIDPKVVYSVADECCCYCPLSCIRCYRCGVQFEDKKPVYRKRIPKQNVYDLEKAGADNKGYGDDGIDEYYYTSYS